ncbi:MAG: hypothetical protein IKU10_04340 [Clostridia bacterium]|nr:hypothetical protein [Clostridia bacterium]
MANHAKQSNYKTSLRMLILALALVLSIVVSTSFTTAGIFSHPANRVIYFTQNSLTISLTGAQSDRIYPGYKVDLEDKATVTIPANQPNCYVFVKVTDANDTNNIVTWAKSTKFPNEPETGIWRSAEVANSASAQTLAIFSSNQLEISTAATLAQIQAATTTNIKVTIQVCAVQADNITEAQALSTAKSQFS